MRAVLTAWERWLPHLKVYQIGDRKGFVLIYLEECVEEDVEKIWNTSAAEGFKHEAIAQTMIMGTLKSLMPDLGEKECAPVPEPTTLLRRTWKKLACACRNPVPCPASMPPSLRIRIALAVNAAT